TNTLQYTASVSATAPVGYPPGARAIQLIDPSTGQAVQITDPGVGVPSSQSLGWAKVLSFNPATGVDPVSGTFNIPNNGLQTGDSVSYQVGPTKSHTITVQNQNPDGSFGTPLTVAVGDQELGGLDQGGIYYVVKIDNAHFRLATDDVAAGLAAPITLTSLG